MYALPKFIPSCISSRYFKPKLFLILSSVFLNSVLCRMVAAQPITTGNSIKYSAHPQIIYHNSSSQLKQTSKDSIAQSTATQSTPPKPAQPRLRPTFFEEERKLRRFGFGDFLRSALDGAQNAFPDPAKVSDFSANSLFDRPGTIRGTLSVASTDDDDDNFLNTTFVAPAANLSFSDINQNSDFRTGSLTINGTVTINGRSITFNNTRAEYNAGFSNKGDRVSALILVTDPDNPRQSIFIQLPPTNVNGFDDSDQINNVPAGLSVGFPTDR